MKKAFRMMLSTLLACLLLVGMMSTAMAATNTTPDDVVLNEQPTGPNYYPDYDEDPVQEVVEEPAAQEPVPASPKTGDNGTMMITLAGVLLMAGSVTVLLILNKKKLH